MVQKASHNLSIIILAAGKGTRMKSQLPKVMHKVAGREMLNMVIDEAKSLNPKNITIVISDEMKDYEENILLSHPQNIINFVIQKERKGTAHATQVALTKVKSLGKKVLVLYGDTPLIERKTLKKMIDKLDSFSVCVLAFDDNEHNTYGRLITNNKGNIEKIVEFKDASNEEKEIPLCNSGVMAISGLRIKELLSKINNKNAAKEFYLTDIVTKSVEESLKCTFLKTKAEEVLGVNSRIELAKIEKIKQKELQKQMMSKGVTLLDPDSIYFSFDTKISCDVVVHPHVFFGKNVTIEDNVEIKSFCHIEGAKIASKATIGPFARIRPETQISQNVHIGNFVEIKKSKLKSGSKINHLSYIGDSEIGEKTNVGAGTITCNYNGYNKYKTTIGKKVFIGSNTSLIAPIKVGDGAVVGAGSVITEDIKKNDLAITRSKQVIIHQGGKKFHDTKSKKNKNNK